MKVLLLLTLGTSLWAITPESYDITSLIESNGAIRLLGNRKVEIEQTWSNGNRVVFEDLKPGANWEHPAKIKVLNAQGKAIEEIQVTRPPKGLEESMNLLRPRNYTPATIAIKDLDGKQKVSDPTKFYAILINGSADQRHWNDFSFLYQTLTKVYGYNKDNIVIADGNYKDRLPDLDADKKPDIQFGSTKEDIKNAILSLKDRVKEGDQLLIAINDHGGREGNESTIVAQDGDIKVSEFAAWVAQIKAGKVLSLYEQCFSGGFVRPTVGWGRVALAAAKDTESSWGTRDGMWDEWIYHIVAAFAMQTHDGKPVTSDFDNDGKISAQEAQSYAIGLDRAPESPVMESGDNSGDSFRMFLN